MKFQKFTVVAAGLVLAASTAACSSVFSSDDDGDVPVSYAPPAYYQTVNNVYECYYIVDPAEAYAKENAGLCPRYAIPTVMPLSWEETWWYYWSSPAYYDTYIPAAYRRTYVSVTCVHFHQVHSTEITRLSRTAVYRGSNGSTVHGITKTTTFTPNTRKTVNYSVPTQPNKTYTYFKKR